MNHRGQATTEMVFLIPLMISLIGAGLFIVYSCWQGIKVQQAANIAGRIQGEERISGGLSKDAIEDTNGVGLNMTLSNGDEDPTDSQKKHYRQGFPSPSSVYGRLRMVVRDFFGARANQVYVPPPQVGQNIDKVKVIRVINLPKIPFFDWQPGQEQLKLVGTAWGGEDTFMYGLPRWGKTNRRGDQDMEWRRQVSMNTEHD